MTGRFAPEPDLPSSVARNKRLRRTVLGIDENDVLGNALRCVDRQEHYRMLEQFRHRMDCAACEEQQLAGGLKSTSVAGSPIQTVPRPETT
jgi:hypothetical protein